MQKNELLQYDGRIVRILDVKEGSALIINCLQRSMPKWVEQSELNDYSPCTEDELAEATGRSICDYDSLDKLSRRIVHEHFTLIAGVLSFDSDDRKRCSMIAEIAERREISKQTVRNYLWSYLVYQDIAALAPKQKRKIDKLTQDQKNMRWALNKFFYTRHKNSLNTAYMMMLKEKYCDSSGLLVSAYPTIHQFRYFYRKHNKKQTYYITREGLKKYQRDYRPLLGDGIQEFAPSIGVGMLDATVCDIYLVDEAGNLVGRPILTACVDAYSGLCCGYSLSWEGGVYSLRNLMANVITDKVEWCRRFGIMIDAMDWDCKQLPATLVTDMGSEYKSDTFEQIAELGVTVINLPPYRPELKGRVEKFFDLIQSSYKKQLKGKGIIEPDFQERGVHDYRRDACLTMEDFEKIVVHCILYYNCKRIVEGFPFSEAMIRDRVLPYANAIWNWSKNKVGANMIEASYDDLIMTLTPRTTGRFSRNGLIVNKLRYKNENYTEQYLTGGMVVVAYNPDDVSCVWLKNGEIYSVFKLIESRFSGLKLTEVDFVKATQKSHEKAVKSENIQAQIHLDEHIEAIAHNSKHLENTNIKQIRSTRKKEKMRTRVDFVRGGVKNG